MKPEESLKYLLDNFMFHNEKLRSWGKWILMFIDEISTEEEEILIEKVVQKIIEYGLETPTVLFLESWKPAMRYSIQFIRFFFVRSFLPFKEKEADKLMALLEKRSNVEKIILRIEKPKKKNKT